jgi:thioredoxin-related protein
MKLVSSVAAIFAFALGTGACFGQSTADVQLKSAEATALKEHKNVLVMFHASWCGWCHKLEKLMASPQFKPLFDRNYVTVTVDVQEHDTAHPETPGGEALAQKLGAAGQGLPYYLILNPQGKTLKDSRNGADGNIGYPAQPGEVSYFMSMIEITAPHATKSQLSELERFLRKKA